MSKSLERTLITNQLLMSLVLLIALLTAVQSLFEHTLLTITLGVIGIVALLLLARRLWEKVITPLRHLSTGFEALGKEHYTTTLEQAYPVGVYQDLFKALQTLNQAWGEKKDEQSTQLFLLHQLIKNLQAPILIFDENDSLIFANDAFELCFGQAWQEIEKQKAQTLGLIKHRDSWQFENEEINQIWQIDSSEFKDSGRVFSLIVLTNIEKQLKVSQDNAWQRMVRVISHEIKNSLTPIKSLTQALLNKDDINENNKRALTVINQRSNSLHRLIDSYSVVTKSIQLKPTCFKVAVLTNRLSKLYDDLEISNLDDDIEVFADSTLLEQVLINLIKNAVEATEEMGSSERVILQIKEGVSPKRHLTFQVSDRGTGIEQTENLFVPFYSTKPDGQGIGLYFSRKVIELHGGALDLSSRDGGGTIATIDLPICQI